jgi:hypothetical protein
MAYSLNERHVALAFGGGKTTSLDQIVTFETHRLGFLKISSGSIAASDPLVVPNPEPFQTPVPSGRHPVEIAIARFDTDDERIAFARVRFTEAPAVSWEMARVKDQDVSSLKADEFFGYGVDAGTGCFMDPIAGNLLDQRMSQEEEFFNVIIDGMETTYKHTRSWLDFRPSSNREENIICFSSGFGDGSYPSFFGFSIDQAPCVLVTDFLVLSPDDATCE